MVNYQNAKIYTIRCKNNTNFIYVGSTCQELNTRWVEHRRDYKKFPERNIYKIIKDNDGIENFYIELYEYFSCNNKEELLKREGEITREISTMNFHTPGNRVGKTTKEYYEANKEILLQKKHEYGMIKITCECGKEMRIDTLRRHKKTINHLELMKQKEEN